MFATVVGNALDVRKASTDQLFVFCLTLALFGFLRDVERPDRASRTRTSPCSGTNDLHLLGPKDRVGGHQRKHFLLAYPGGKASLAL